MLDYFILRDHEGIVRSCISIHDRPTNFEKLIGFGLDPFVYRLVWHGDNIADVIEYWWGTKFGTIIRVPGPIPTTPIKSNKALTTGFAASPSPYMLNKMI